MPLLSPSIAALMLAYAPNPIASVVEPAQKPALLRLAPRDAQIAIDVAPAAGGELAGLMVWHRGEWIELLHRARDYRPSSGWQGRAPLLWPATGRTFLPRSHEHGWLHQGVTYPMPLHGFARELPWTLERIDRAAGTAVLCLTDTAQTRRLYPFGFRTTAEYRVTRSRLEIDYEVEAAAANSAPMPFSIGNHITLRAPLVPGGDPARVTVATPARARLLTDTRGRPTKLVDASKLFGAPVALGSLEPGKAIALSGYGARPAVRLSDPAGLSVTISHKPQWLPADSPVLFTLWGDPAQGYFSPEPWVGKPNSLATGDGAIMLEPGATYSWTVTIEIGGADSRMP